MMPGVKAAVIDKMPSLNMSDTNSPDPYELILPKIKIPSKYLNALGFLNYDHYGDLPEKTTESDLRKLANLPPEFFRHTKALAIDCEMVGIGERRDSALARVSFVNQFGVKVYDRWILPPKGSVITDYRTETSGIYPGDLEYAFEYKWIRSEIEKFLKNKILVGHSVHNDLEILNLTHPISKIRDTACYFKPRNRYSVSLKDLIRTHLHCDIQEGAHSSIQDAQATMKLYLMFRKDWEAGLNTIIGPNDIKSINIVPRKGDISMDSAQDIYLRSIKPCYTSTQEYMDVQFRLLHEDFMKPLREGIHAFRLPTLVSPRQRDGAKIRTFTNVTPMLSTTDLKELRGKAKFQIPIQENHLDSIDWETSKGFINGSLVALTPDNFKTIKFGTVSFIGPRELRVDSLKDGILEVHFFPDGPTWTVSSNTKFLLIESVPFFEGYQRSLEAFQRLELSSFPVKKYIVDGVTDFDKVKDYGTRNTRIDFSCFLRNSKATQTIYNLLEPGSWPPAEDLGFNESQYMAFKAALTQEFSIVQGPPGTGKTFTGLSVIKALITNPHLLSKPILIVAQTNHALDHLLEGVLHFAEAYFGSGSKAEDAILRIGGGSRSEEISNRLTARQKSNKLGWKKSVSTLLPMYESGYDAAKSFFTRETPFRRNELLGIGVELCIIQNTMKKLISEIRKFGDPYNLQNPVKWLDIVSQFYGCYFTTKHRGGKTVVEVLKGVLNRESWLFHEIQSQLVIKDIILEILALFKGEIDGLGAEWEKLKDFKGNNNGVLVIGATATGACKYKEYELKKLKPGILIVEEAGHVLEAHIVAGLTKHMNQVILIGDHQQLRPSTSDYQLTKQYGVDISLMERLVTHALAQGKKNWIQLNVQHRMRPEIARLITPTIYPELFNSENVGLYPVVRGVNKNIFFFQHQFRESREHGSTSFINPMEADFIHKLCLYFIFQGYREDRICVITTYLGQKNLLETKFKNNLLTKEVRISCVDGFQGEENDIILLSLVRNNRNNNIGFMETDNRLCVALSRARHGLFIAGDMNSLSLKSKTWAAVNETLKSMDSIGDKLDLYCHYHKKTLAQIGCGRSILMTKCNMICGHLLQCGHKCKRLCHIYPDTIMEYERHECEVMKCYETRPYLEPKVDTESLVELLSSTHIIDEPSTSTSPSPSQTGTETEESESEKDVEFVEQSDTKTPTGKTVTPGFSIVRLMDLLQLEPCKHKSKPEEGETECGRGHGHGDISADSGNSSSHDHESASTSASE